MADALFHVFTYSRKVSDCVELASGKTGKNGEFSYPVEQSDVEKFPPPFFFAEIPGNGHFAANLQINKAEPVVLKAWGPWADLVVTFTTPDGKPASGLHGRVTQVYDTTDEFLLDVPRLPTGTWDATTDSNGQLILHGLPVHYRFYLEMDDARYAQLMGHNSPPNGSLRAGRSP